ncbi:hypothetical protein CEP52_016339 [Fusarium oligoseptatum]|uniref:Uncharacterized protein n=1 Tax=Fusarium oligoseptatum TaxID=2604345 RepID=A0A428S4R3_9HYPO|nr:hypothetical protein CEP52_016339 [Fusarium oligoseptatum]
MGKELPDLPIDTEWAPGWPAISSSQHDEDDLDSEDVQVGAIDLESALANESDDTGNDDGSRSDSHSDKTDDDGDDDDDEDEANGSDKNLVSEYLRHVYDSSSEGHTADNRASPYPEEQRTPCNWQTWQHLRHYTISKDQTRASASETAKLTAVRQSSYTSAAIVVASNVKQPSVSGKKVDIPDYQMQMMLLEQQNKKKIDDGEARTRQGTTRDSRHGRPGTRLSSRPVVTHWEHSRPPWKGQRVVKCRPDRPARGANPNAPQAAEFPQIYYHAVPTCR